MAAALEAVGSSAVYLEYPGVDHYVQRRLFEQPDLFMPWLFAQKRGQAASAPDHSGLYEFSKDLYFNFNSMPANWTLDSYTAQNAQLNASLAASEVKFADYGKTDVPMNNVLITSFITVKSDSGGGGPVFYYKDTKNAYHARLTGSNKVELLAATGVSFSPVASASADIKKDKIACLKVELVDSIIKVYVDNVLKITHDAGSCATTESKIGFRWYGGSGSIDDLVVAVKESVASAGLRLNDLADRQVLQRNPKTEDGIAHLSASANETAQNVQNHS
jgi:hypothetical protein